MVIAVTYKLSINSSTKLLAATELKAARRRPGSPICCSSSIFRY